MEVSKELAHRYVFVSANTLILSNTAVKTSNLALHILSHILFKQNKACVCVCVCVCLCTHTEPLPRRTHRHNVVTKLMPYIAVLLYKHIVRATYLIGAPRWHSG